MAPRTRLALSGMIAAGFVVAAVVLSLSDRVGVGVGAVTSSIRALLHRIERLFDIDVVDRSDVPFSVDVLGHAALWGAGMLLIGWLFRLRVRLIPVAAGVFALSLAIEVGQHLFSHSRSMQADDAIANLVGISAATAVVASVGWMVDLARRLQREP